MGGNFIALAIKDSVFGIPIGDNDRLLANEFRNNDKTIVGNAHIEMVLKNNDSTSHNVFLDWDYSRARNSFRHLENIKSIAVITEDYYVNAYTDSLCDIKHKYNGRYDNFTNLEEKPWMIDQLKFLRNYIETGDLYYPDIMPTVRQERYRKELKNYKQSVRILNKRNCKAKIWDYKDLVLQSNKSSVESLMEYIGVPDEKMPSTVNRFMRLCNDYTYNNHKITREFLDEMGF